MMHVDAIDNAADLARLKDAWRAVYDADPDAQYFLSWDWMSKWLTDGPNWVVLAARPVRGAPPCAFLPLRLQVSGLKGGGICTLVAMAGQGVADYTGLLCRPEVEEPAIKALCDHVRKMGWHTLRFGSFRASDARMRRLERQFPAGDFALEDYDAIYPDGTDHSVYPFVTLPGDWETYLTTKLSKDTRRKVRRFTRQVEQADEFRVTLADAQSLERDLEILFRFWNLKWGNDRSKSYVAMHMDMFRHCATLGTLFLPVMWQGDRPLGALANLLDDSKKTMLFKIFSRDESFGNPSPGLILYAYAIRCAIEKGYAVCDFLQGNHGFKYSFGAEDRMVFQKKVTRQLQRRDARLLDRRCLHAALQTAQQLHRQGRLAEAEQHYRQILQVDPTHAEVRSRLAQIPAGTQDTDRKVLQAGQHLSAGRPADAARLLRGVVKSRMEDGSVRMMLGVALLQLRQFEEARVHLAAAAALKPEVPAVQNSYGCCLFALGRAAEAVRAFDRVLALDPDHEQARVNRDAALRAPQRSGKVAALAAS